MTNSIVKKGNNGGSSLPRTSFSNLVDEFFQDNLSRFFDDHFWSSGNSNHSRSNVPVNIRENDKTYEMELIAPGLKKEDFKVDINGDMLTVSFNHHDKKEEEDKQAGWLRKEYRQQSFSRSFNLDDTIDVNRIDASYRDGVLHLSLPKKEGAQRIAKTITIK